jgi:hypothetical protein
MNYHIEIFTKDKWERIASFKNEFDSEDCCNLLEEKYVDYVFRTVYEEE